MSSFNVTLNDHPTYAQSLKSMLDIPRDQAFQRAKKSLEIQDQQGYRLSPSSQWIDLSARMEKARKEKKSIAFDQLLPSPPSITHLSPSSLPKIQINNETTLMAAHRFVSEGHKIFVLNFANGRIYGGGFLSGSRAQEESLCWASTLYDTLLDDQMYSIHERIPLAASSAHAILSTAHVFTDDQHQLVKPWSMDVLTMAAPVCRKHRCPEAIAKQLMHSRIHRVYQIAQAYGYNRLVLGAFGCGAFGNSTYSTAKSFRVHLEQSFKGQFEEITFAITDWSPERRFISPFYQVFNA